MRPWEGASTELHKKAVIVGGDAAMKPSVSGQLTFAGVKSVERLGGANAWRTSELIAGWGLKHGLSAQTVGVADGNGYRDARPQVFTPVALIV